VSEAQHGEQGSSWEQAVRQLLGDPAKAELVQACYFDQPLEVAADRYAASPEWRAIGTFLPKATGLAALDLGAGNGIASHALAQAGFQVTAVEPDPSGLVGAAAIRGLAARRSLAIEVIESWGEQLPLPDARFDIVLARQVMHHARSLEQLTAELFRVLKPGGRLLAIRDHVVTDEAQLPAFYASHPLHSQYGGEHAYTRAAYADALRSAGFLIHAELGSFDSPINLAPHTPETFADAAASRGARIPGAATLIRQLLSPRMFPVIAPLLSAIDRRPGRLVSFVADRPGISA